MSYGLSFGLLKEAHFWIASCSIFCLYLFFKFFPSFHTLSDPRIESQAIEDHAAKPVNEACTSPVKRRSKSTQSYDAFLILDVEATCERGTDFYYPNEVIEFPVCLMMWTDNSRTKLAVIDEFRTFVKPSWRPVLSEFCTELTGITQAQIDDAPSFPVVLSSFARFLVKHGMIEEATGKRKMQFCWCTDGPWDIRDFVVKQCFISKVVMPEWITGRFLNVRMMVTDWSMTQNNQGGRRLKAKLAKNHPERPSLNITSQLRILGLTGFEGREHSGIDDARNIARIVAELARKGIHMRPNTAVNPGRRWQWMGKSGQVLDMYL